MVCDSVYFSKLVLVVGMRFNGFAQGFEDVAKVLEKDVRESVRVACSREVDRDRVFSDYRDRIKELALLKNRVYLCRFLASIFKELSTKSISMCRDLEKFEKKLLKIARGEVDFEKALDIALDVLKSLGVEIDNDKYLNIGEYTVYKIFNEFCEGV